jgi:hypothetical protein
VSLQQNSHPGGRAVTETYLNVPVEDLREAVRRCFAAGTADWLYVHFRAPDGNI